VDFAEIPIGKFVVSLCLLGVFVVDSQIPPAVFAYFMMMPVNVWLLAIPPGTALSPLRN
jgi:hypothetical protein